MIRPFAHRFRPATVLEVSGEDAFGFLQGQFSNDIRPASAGTVTYGLWLNPKGKVEGDAFLIQRDDKSFLLISPGCPADALGSRLESFIIADDVTLNNVTARWSGIAVWGPDAAAKSAAVLGVPTPDGRHAHDHDGIVGFASHRWGAGTVEWLFATGDAAVIDARNKFLAAGFSTLTETGADQERILRGGVSVPLELGATDLPQEAGIEGIAVSFTKGCFIGQEVMARLKAMGRVRRGLIRVRGKRTPPPGATELFCGGRLVGELRSMVPLQSGDFIGRAMVTLTDLPSEFSLGSSKPDAPMVVRDDS